MSNVGVHLANARDYFNRLWMPLLRRSDCGTYAVCETSHGSAQSIRCSKASRVRFRHVFRNLGRILVLADIGELLDSHQPVWWSWPVRPARFSVLGSNCCDASGARLDHSFFSANARLWQWLVELGCGSRDVGPSCPLTGRSTRTSHRPALPCPPVISNVRRQEHLRPRQFQEEHHGQIPHLVPKRCDGRSRR